MLAGMMEIVVRSETEVDLKIQKHREMLETEYLVTLALRSAALIEAIQKVEAVGSRTY